MQSNRQSSPLSRAAIICVFSPKGGIACTTIAVNLAVALRQTAGQKTILVDGDLGFGDVDSALDMTPTTSVATLLPDLDEIDDQLLDRMPVSHSAGIKVLLAPPYLDAAEAIPPEQLRQLLGHLSGLGDG